MIWGHVEGTIVAVYEDRIETAEVDIGVTTFAGRHYNVIHGTYYFSGNAASHGTWTGANEKGTLDWEAAPSGPNTFEITMTSGTGTMLGATGHFTSTQSNLQIDFATGAISYDYTGTGELTFPAK